MEDFERDRMRRDGMVRDRDLIIPQSHYAFILDKTKGIVGVCVGPFKTSLAGTDQPVRYDEDKREFVECDISLAIKQFPVAKDGSYLVLENPATGDKHPKQGAGGMEDLDYGRKVNIRGPVTFPLWAGQIAKVIPGHNLKSNEYLLVRVYNEEEAKENWKEAVIKPQSSASDIEEKSIVTDEKSDDIDEKSGHIDEKSGHIDEKSGHIDEKQQEKPDLTTGKQLIIKGTEVSFYIPPTGIEVVPDSDGNFVRNATTLERLEYCILLDEDGNKRYVKGPAVVFPKPTETFITEKGSKKFRAIELNEISGIYIKVIADYKDNEDGKEHKVGEELFITGKDQMIYYPRPEHAIIKYDDNEKIHSIAIPNGEARYVLNRLTGEISLKKGPVMFLPDPRTEVIVRRVLDPNIVSIWFPGNTDALEYNKRMTDARKERTNDEFVTERDMERMERSFGQKSFNTSYNASVDDITRSISLAKEKFAGDAIDRKTKFTPPRMITLDTKYSGAVSIDVWTGYAILIINKNGDRRVVVGPKTVLLEYDEILGIMELSTGKPKTDNVLIKTAYLRIANNKVSDIITVETKDLVKVEIRLSYLVNFIGDPEKWFDAENYVKLLTQHLRSVIANAVKKIGIEQFYDNSTDIIRDTVLGKSKDSDSERPCHLFKENGMHIYDVEVLGVKITDENIAVSLIKAQRDVVSQTLDLAAKRRELESTKEKEKISQDIAELKNDTIIKTLKLRQQETDEILKTNIDILNADIKEKVLESDINKARLAIEKDGADQTQKINEEIQRLEIEMMEAGTKQMADILKAIQPELIATLKMLGNQELAKALAYNLPKAAGSFGLLTERGGLSSLMKMIKDTPMDEGIKALLENAIPSDKERVKDDEEEK